MTKAKIAILGASGYTGAELIRLLLAHPHVELVALTADSKAGKSLSDVFPQFVGVNLPDLIALDAVDYTKIDIVLCALPHATTQKVVTQAFAVNPKLKIIDLSADFRIHNPEHYAKWYGHEHAALALQNEAVYGLTELYRAQVKSARLVANPGCYTTTSLLPLIPVVKAGLIDAHAIVIDAKSGVTGAGRAAKEANLFTEVSDGFHAYGVGSHRHMAELDQELSIAAGQAITPRFTPHLVPMNRGIFATIYVTLAAGNTAQDVHACLNAQYANEHFVQVLPFGGVPQTRHVRGSNQVLIGVSADRAPHHAIITCVLDNLVKGASGQAIQNMNVVMGWPEITGLEHRGMFP